MRSVKRFMPFSLFLGFGLLGALALSGFGKSSQEQPLQSPKSPAPAKTDSAVKSDYATTSACATCHEDLTKKFVRNPHQALEVKTSGEWKDRACESCHGPGQAHIDAGDGTQIFSFPQAAPQDINARCLTCHARTHEVAGMSGGLHGKNQLACTECHHIHEAAQPVHLLTAAPAQLCSGCHKEISASFAKPFAHHLREGAVSCVDCHRPHQALGVKSRRTRTMFLQSAYGNEAPCLKCHADKRGPFAFEHAPMRLEGCLSCHEPHGSINPKMLIRNQVRFLCLECHSATTAALTAQPPSFHDLRSPRFQNCTTCHLKIHGSHVSKFFLR